MLIERIQPKDRILVGIRLPSIGPHMTPSLDIDQTGRDRIRPEDIVKVIGREVKDARCSFSASVSEAYLACSNLFALCLFAALSSSRSVVQIWRFSHKGSLPVWLGLSSSGSCIFGLTRSAS